MRRFLTWRNAIIGGVGAFTLLGFSVFAYFVMWSTGIGPVGSLVAQGVIEAGERVVLADFEDGSGEGYASAVTEALRIDLLEAEVLTLTEAPEIASTLELMQVEPGSEVTAARALEIAQRIGAAAVIDGEVTSLGTGYLLTATLREAATGRALASFRETANGPEDLILSTDRLSQDLRERSGESLRTIRAGTPLERATTTSLEALRLYSEASEAYYSYSDAPLSAELLQLALAEDSTFAMGWRMLAIALQGGVAPTRAAEANSNAFRYRERLQPLERYLTEALYFTGVRSDVPRMVEAYRNVLRLEPGDFRALNNLGLNLEQQYYEFDAAEELLREAIAGPRTAFPHYLVLVGILLSAGRVEEAAEMTAEGEERFAVLSDSPLPTRVRFAQGDVQGATDLALRRSEDMALSLRERAQATGELAALAYHQGRLDEGRGLFLRAEAMDAEAGGAARWRRVLEAIYTEALVGDGSWALEHGREGLAGPFAEVDRFGRRHPQSAIFLASAGDAEAAQFVENDFRASFPAAWQGPSDLARLERAALYGRVAAGDTVGAVETMERLLQAWGCSDVCWSFDRARMHDRLGDHERAIELYQRVPSRPVNIRWLYPVVEQTYVKLRLGPLYEELGETDKAIEAYQQVVDQWADGDARGLERVAQFRARIAELGG